MGPPRRRGLDAGDAELWRRVAETVKPLKGRRPPARTGSDTPESGEPAVDRAGSTEEPGAAPATGPAPSPPSPPQPAPGTPSSRLDAVDRRLVRRIGRGARAVDAVVDLHGLTQREAHDRLLAFLRAAQDRGHRLVLVVTGKGSSAGAPDWWQEGARGILRRAVPEWLATPAFRGLVVGYEQAHARKGGEGAIYVQVRRRDRRPGP